MVLEEVILLSLIGDLLLVDSLLCKDHVANFEERVKLDASFRDHVVDFHDPRKGGHAWTRALGLVHAVTVAAGEVAQDSTRSGDLVQS